MNKIFKVVWNRTIGSFVVTSELAKGRVKSSSEGAEGDVRASEEGRLKTLFRLTALSAALLGFSEGAWAVIASPAAVANGSGGETAVNGAHANGTGAVAVGAYARAGTRAAPPNGLNTGAIAIGGSDPTTATYADGNNAIAIGTGSNSNAAKATAVGADTVASDQWTTALGGRAEAKARGATAIGSWTQATGQFAVAIGGSDRFGRDKNTELNDGSGATLASGTRSTAIGRRAMASGNDTLAFGTNAKATGVDAVAFGTNANASILKSIAIGKNTQATGEASIVIGSDDHVYGEIKSTSRQGIAIGAGAKAIGLNQAVAIGPDATASGQQSTSIGNNTRAAGDSSIAIGGDDWDIAKESVNTQYKKLTGSDMSSGYQGTTAATAAVAVGVKAQATGALSTAFGPGTIASGLGASAFGVGASATQDKSVAIGAGSTTTINAEKITTATVNDITYGGFAGTNNLTHGSQVSFGTKGYERQLKNVAPGAITSTSTDAINGSQLYALHAGSGNIAKAVANALGGGAAVGIDPTNNQGTVTLPSYNVLKGSATPNMAGNGTANFNANPARSVADALTNLNTYVNQGFAVKDNSGTAKGIVTPGESVQFADGKATTVTVETEADGNTKVKYDVQVDGETVRIENGKLTAASQTHYYSVNRPGTPVANYNNDGATGENAIAAGPEAKAAASNAVAIGSKATVEAAAGSDSTINGDTTGEGSVAVGSLSKANGKNATAIGQKANAYGQNSFAGGQDTESSGKSSVAVGDGSRATDDSTTAVGPYAKAQKAGASAFGFNANAQAIGSVAVGRQAQALNLNAVSVGNESKAKGEDTVAIGTSADAVQNRAMAIGKGAVANDADTIAFGAGTKADKRYAIAIGSGNNAWKTDSIALGRAANADGEASLALGLNSHTRLQNAIALGNGANADHSNSIAIGKFSHAAESAGVAIGNDARALKFSSVVIGDQAQSNNSRSVVIGFNASATNPAKPASAETDYNQTVAIGAYANAWGDQSTAIGNNVFAKGNSSIAIGADDWDTVAAKTVDGMDGKTVKEVYQDYTGDEMQTGKNSYTLTTSGEAAVAIGTKSQATAELSTAFGTGTRAQGIASAAFGMGAKATKGNSVAIGAGSTTATDATKVNEATVNNLKYSGFAGGNNVTSGDQVSFGSKNYERQLKNVAPGEISNTSTDAINGSQLYAVQNVLGNTAKTVKDVLGSNAKLAEDGSITMNNIGGTGENTVDRAIASLKTSAFKSFQLETAAAAGTNGRAENHSLQEITSGSTLRLEAGKNIHLNQSGSTVSINTVDNPEFTGVVTAKGGLNMFGNRITNLGQGTDTNDAVNVGQLQDAMNNLRVNTLTTVSNDAPFSYIDKDGKLLTRNVKEVGGKKVVSFTYVDGGAEYTGDVTIAALNAKDPQTSVPTIVGNVKSGIKDNDAVNVSQLKKIAEALGTQVGTDGSVSMPTYAVVSDSPATSSVVNYNTVGDALSALNRAVNSPLNFTGDVGNQFNRKLGSTVAVKGGQTDQTKLSDNNIGVVSDDQNHTLNVKLAKELTGLTSAVFSGDVTAAGTTVNGSGVTIGSGSNPVKLTAGGLSNGGHKITNIADGEADNDAASYKQVKAAKTEVQGGTNVASVTKIDNPTDGHTVYTINAKGAAVALDSSVDGLKLTSSENLTTNVTTYNLDLSDKTKESLKKADSALQNIGVQVNGAAAKTLNQADSILNFVDGTGTTAENKNGTVAFNVNKSTLTAGTGGVISADTAGDAFATATDVANAINKAVADSEKISIVAAGDNTHVASQVTGNQTLYTVHADKTTVSVKSDGKLALNPTESTNSNQTKTTNYELDLTDAAKSEIQKGVDAKNIVDTKGITFNGDSGSPVTKKLDETLAIKGDDKNVVTEAGTDGIKVKLKDDITLTSVTADTLKAGNSELTTTGLTTPKVTAGDSVLTTDGLTIANGANPVSLTKSGLNNGGNKIANVAKGTDATDGVNVSQLSPIAKALNTSIDPATGNVAAPAFTVTKADGTKHEAAGTVQDALNKVGEEVSKGLKIAADNGDADKVNLGETVTYTSKDQNIVTTVTDNKIDFSLADKITVGKAGQNPVVIDGVNGTVSGLTNTTLGGTDFATSNKAATEAQLDATQVNLKNILGGEAKNENGNVSTANIGDTGKANVHEAIKSVKETAEKGWKLKVNEEASSEKISPDDEVAIKEGKNIKVTRNGKNITVATAENVEFNKVTVGDSILTSAGLTTPKVTAGDSVLTTDGLTIANGANPVSLTKSGLNNGGNKITKVAKGTDDTDAVNVSQLNPVAKALNTNIDPATGNVAAPAFTVTKADGTKHEAVGTVQDALNKVGEEVSKGLKIAADNGDADKVNLGETVTYTSKDQNIVTTVTDNKIDFSLADKITVGKAGQNPVVIDGVNGTVSGLTNTTLGGTDFATSNKAATEAQLDATQVNLKNILGGEAKNENGNVSTANIGDTGKANVHEAIKSVKETAEKGWKLKVNEEASSEKISPDDEVAIKEGKNIKVTRNGKNITVATSDDVEFNAVNATNVIAETVIAGNSVLTTEGLKIGADNSPSQVSLTTAGLSNGGNKIAKVAKGTADTDAVNFSQLNPIAKALNTTVNPDGSIAAPNFTVKHADGTEGTPVHTVQDALDKVGEEVTKGINVGGTTGSNKYALGGTINIKGDSNIVSDTVEGGVQLKLADTVKIGQDSGKPVSIDGTTGTVSGLSNTTLGAAPLAGSNKAATEAQLDATQVNLATILGGNAANNNGNVTTSNIGGTGKDNVHEAIAAVKETADKGWNLKANDEADSEKIAAGDTVTVKQGKNIRVKRSGKELTVETEDDVEFTHVKADSVEAASVVADSVIAGNSVLTTEGLKIGADGSPSQVSLTTAGLNNGGNKVTNVAKGTADTDGVNVSQLNPVAKALNTNIDPTTGEVAAPSFTVTKADGTKHPAVGTVQDALDKVGEEVTKGLNIVADNGSSEKVNLGDTVKYTSKDKNIVTTSGTGKEIDFSLAEKVTIGKDAANGGKPVVIDGKEGIVSGLTNTTLGAAPLADSNKAATEAQLDATQVNLANVLGGNAANNNGNVTTSDIGGTGENNVHDAIKSVKATADKGWKLKANDEADSDSEKIAAGDTVTVKQGKNIRVKRSGKELTVETEDDVEFGTVSATTVLADSFISGNSVLSGEGLKIGADGSPSQVSLTNAGLNNGGNKIANVAKGTADTDAVNVAQLNEQLAATEKTTTVVAGKNVTVSEKVDGNNTEYTVNADKTTLSQVANGAVKVSEGAKDADGVTDYALDLTDEAKADIAKGVAAKDAVDNKGLTFAADNGTTGAKKLGDSLSVKGDGNILTRADENGIGFSLADKITVGKAGNGNKPLVIDGTAGLISGLSNTTLGGADFATKGQAASEEQLNAAQANLANLLGGNAANDKGNVTTTDIGGTGKDNVHDAIAAVKATADKGWNLNANDETSSEKIGAGDTVTFKEGKNVKVSRNGKHITVATSDDVSFDKVTVGGSVLTDNGLTVGNGKAGKPVSLTKDGLNNGGNKVTDIAAGEADTDAVNVAQLKAAAAKATSKVDSGNDNIVVTPEQNADGSTTYKVATAPNLKADSFTAGDTVVNNDGVKVGDKVALGKDGLKAGDVNITADGINAGNKAISNVAAGVKDTDAANVGQLNRLTAAAKTEVEAGTNIASVTSKQGANGQTVYTVNADGASVSAGSDNIVVTKGNKDANNVTDYAVDLSKAVKADIAKGVAAKDAVDNKGISFAGDSGTTVANKLGDTVAVKGDANITTTAGANGIQVSLNKDLKVDSVEAGDTVVNNNGVNVGDKVALGKDGLKAGDVNITADGINAGGKKVTGVAAGTVAAGSTDAVNGGQLHQVYELIGSNGGNVNTAPPSVEADGKAGLGNIKNITLVDNSNNPNVTNVTNETKIAQSNGYSLVTYNVEDQGMYVTNNVIEAVGRMNEQGIKFFHTNDGEVEPDVQARNSEDSSASGAYATAVGYQAASKGTNAIAIGKGAKANAENTIAIGTGNIVSGKNSGAIGDPTVVSGNSSYSIGNNNNVSADNAYALGSNIKATVNDSVYLGDRAQTQGIHTADAAKGEAYTYGGLNDKAVAGKAGSAAAANKVAGVVTVGNGTDETRQVQGVAAGVVSADSTDAINGSQLYYTNQAINQNVTNIGNYVVNMGNQINQRIDNVESDSKAGTAAAMAVAGLPQAYLPGKSMMAVAGGVYRGESGYAVGFSSISDGGNWIIKGTATGNSRGHYGATAGVGYQW